MIFKFLRYIPFFLLIFFLGSCVPGKEISFESLEPSNYSVPVETDSVLVVNLSYYPWIDTTSFNILKNLYRSEAYIVDTMINRAIFDGLFYILDESPVQAIADNKYTELRGDNRESFMQPLDLQSVDFLCNENNSGVIFTLEYYGVNLSDSLLPNIYGELYRQLTIRRYLLWRIYEQGYGMVDEYHERDTLIWNEYNPGDLPDLVTIIKETFWYAGEKFGKYVSPGWSEQKRNIFYISYQLLDISENMKMLMQVANQKQGYKSFMAYYNLAVLYEREGLLNDAMEAIESAIKLRPSSEVAGDYKQKLSEAVKQRELLDTQLR